MNMDVNRLEGLRCHGVFYTGFICKGYIKGVAKVIVDVCIPRLWTMRKIWDDVLVKLRVSFDVLVSIKKVLSECCHCIYTHVLCSCISS